jgi:hypothetical protein
MASSDAIYDGLSLVAAFGRSARAENPSSLFRALKCSLDDGRE